MYKLKKECHGNVKTMNIFAKNILIMNCLKHLKFGLICLTLLSGMAFSVEAEAKPVSKAEKVFVDWRMLAEENQKMVDVFYRIIECDSDTIIEFKVFNENATEQNIAFDVSISAPMNSKTHTESFSMKIKGGEMFFPVCGTHAHADLAVKLPSDFNVSVPLMFSIKFK